MAAVLAPSDESDEQKCAKAAEAVYIKTRWNLGERNHNASTRSSRVWSKCFEVLEWVRE